MAEIKYPECEKWGAVHDWAVAILNFHEWYEKQPKDRGMKTMEQWVYEYFDVDPKKLEAERSAMLEELRK